MKNYFILIGLLTLLAVFLIVMRNCNRSQERKIEELKARIDELQDLQTLLQFRVTGRDSNVVEFELELLNADGQEVAKKALVMKGHEINFDFIVVHLDSSYLAFPYKIFTDQIAPDNGFDLMPLYNQDGFPAVYQGNGYSEDLKAGIETLFRHLQGGDFYKLPGYFGSAVHDVKGIRRFLPDQDYRIVIRRKGGVEILRL